METRTAPPPPEETSDAGNALDEPETLAWKAHPAAQRPAQAILALGIILIVAGFVFITTASIGLAALGVVLLAGALNRFFFPSRFSIDEECITARYPMKRMRYCWSDLQRFVWDEHGGYLSTRATPSRLDAYRGMHLLFDDDRERIIERIRARMKGEQSR